MWLFYAFAFVPILIGMVLFFLNRQVVWQEWVGSAGVAFFVALFVSLIACAGMTEDYEMWSGQIVRAVHYPEWIEEYLEAVYRTVTHTDSNGNTYTTQEFSHFETRHRTHSEYWEAETSLDYSKNINRNFFEEISRNFNNLTTEKPYKGGFDGGDPNIYVAYNKSGYVYPVTDTRRFENRVKAAPTVFSFPKVPNNLPIYEWNDTHDDWLHSGRLLGCAGRNIELLAFDRMNSYLGPHKRVNVIMIGFAPSDGSDLAHWQEAKWVGGKKNDLVLCYGGWTTNRIPTWSYVFGWTEQEIVKRNLETLLLTHPMDTSILPLIQKEIEDHYLIKDWSKFDYISIEPATWAYVMYFIFMILAQAGYWCWAFTNDIDKEETENMDLRNF